MSEDEMRQWALLSNNPDRMYELDCHGRTVLLAAVRLGRATLVAWLIDEQGVSLHGHCPLPKQLLHFPRREKRGRDCKTCEKVMTTRSEF
jgi:hypothetical protein